MIKNMSFTFNLNNFICSSPNLKLYCGDKSAEMWGTGNKRKIQSGIFMSQPGI